MEKEVLTPFPPCSHTCASCYTLSDPILAILAGTANSPATWGASTRKPLWFSGKPQRLVSNQGEFLKPSTHLGAFITTFKMFNTTPRTRNKTRTPDK